MIKTRQNEDKSIMILKAESKLYSEAKLLVLIKNLLCVFLPLFINVVFGKKSLPYIAVGLVALFVSFLFDDVIKAKKKRAAQIQQCFDSYVFNIPFNCEGLTEDNLLEDIVKYSNKKRKKDDKKSFENWYAVTENNYNESKAIKACQRESVSWDRTLKKYYYWIIIIFYSIFQITITIYFIYDSDSLKLWLCEEILLSSITKLFIQNVICIKNSIKEADSIYDEINGNEYDKNIIQSKIYEYRKNSFLIPDLLHLLCKNKMEKFYNDVNELENKH